MKGIRPRTLIVWLVFGAFAAAVAFATCRAHARLGNPLIVSGWGLTGLFIFLALFNVRKRLSMMPLGSAATWLLLHVVGGLVAVILFWVHTKTLWPEGLYEQMLALFFYLITLNGIFGYVLQRIYPNRLTQSGIEILYERIPAELALIQEEAEKGILDCTKETSSDTLAKHYLETLHWFFHRPRFFVSHAVGGRKGQHWIQHHFETVKRYLNQAERGHLEKLVSLAETKNKIDFHFAAQSMMKGWLLVHVPLTAGLLALAGWHIFLVHVYAL